MSNLPQARSPASSSCRTISRRTGSERAWSTAVRERGACESGLDRLIVLFDFTRTIKNLHLDVNHLFFSSNLIELIDRNFEEFMKSWVIEKAGREHLHLVEGAKPQPGAGEILVRTQSVSLNYRDKTIVEGTYPLPVKFPIVLGSDMAGEVVATGSNVTRFRPGDKVVSVYKPGWIDGVPTPEQNSGTLGGSLPGVFAEYVLLAEESALRYPKYLSEAQASTLPIAAVTAWVGLFKHGHLTAGETVLVQGSGGTSIFGLQLATAHGARVIATSRSASKAERLKKLGAAEVIDTSKHPQWDKEVLRLTGGKGVDHVLEVVGGEAVPRSIEASAWGGHIAVIGYMDTETTTISIPPILGKALRLQGVTVGSRRDMEDLLTFLTEHPIEPVIDAAYPFDALPDALDHLDRGPFGKVIVEVTKS
jgi:NADPH:quinone reductase-like Zn-dependent oxidoreductase